MITSSVSSLTKAKQRFQALANDGERIKTCKVTINGTFDIVNWEGLEELLGRFKGSLASIQVHDVVWGDKEGEDDAELS